MKKILIVDDSQVSRKILKTMLEEEGFTVVGEGTNGKEGFDLYSSLQPDIVIMDVTMPKMSGLDSLKFIRVYDPEAKVVILSSSASDEYIEEAKKLGAKDYIVKPYEKKALIDALNRL